jgi:hypothetical protein
MQEVDLLAGELRRAGGSRAILVTSKAHTRRVRATWWARVGSSPEAIVRYTQADPYEPERVSREVFAMVNVWTGFPVQPAGR